LNTSAPAAFHITSQSTTPYTSDGEEDTLPIADLSFNVADEPPHNAPQLEEEQFVI